MVLGPSSQLSWPLMMGRSYRVCMYRRVQDWAVSLTDEVAANISVRGSCWRYVSMILSKLCLKFFLNSFQAVLCLWVCLLCVCVCGPGAEKSCSVNSTETLDPCMGNTIRVIGIKSKFVVLKIPERKSHCALGWNLVSVGGHRFTSGNSQILLLHFANGGRCE